MDGQTLSTWAGIAVAASIGAWGIRQATRANTHAATSAKASADAVELAKNADARADGLERVEFERSDVERASRFDRPSNQWVIENVGQDTGCDVQVTAEFDGAEEAIKASGVARRKSLIFDLSQLAPQVRTWRSAAGRWSVHVLKAEEVRIDD